MTVLLAGIGFEPEIAGYLAVGAGVLTFFGSVYLLLGTNLGTRLGFLVSFTGLMAWMLLLGIVWWVYGIGLKGIDASWEIDEVVFGDTAVAQVEAARTLSGIEPSETSPIPEPWVDVPESEQGDILAASDAAVLDPPVVVQGQIHGTPPGTDDFKVLKVVETGGDRYRVFGIPDTVFTRFFVPSRGEEHHIVVQVRRNIEAPPIDLNAPPAERVVDASGDLISVVMTRDQGDRRFPPAMTTLGSGILFVLGVWVMHRRDLSLREAQAAYDAEVE